jgi:hypothetical protein
MESADFVVISGGVVALGLGLALEARRRQPTAPSCASRRSPHPDCTLDVEERRLVMDFASKATTAPST